MHRMDRKAASMCAWALYCSELAQKAEIESVKNVITSLRYYLHTVAVYSSKSLKPCVSAPTCSAHKHRPRPAPCPQPDKCFKKCIKQKNKCPSAMGIVTRAGSPCDCARIQSKDSRKTHKRTNKTHRKRIRKASKQRSQESRWRKQGTCCVIL